MEALESLALKAVLYAFSVIPALKASCVLKGGNALKIGYNSPRSSADLDFTSTLQLSNRASEHEEALRSFQEFLTLGLERAARKFGLMLVIARAAVLPDRDPRRFPSFEIKIGYADRATTYTSEQLDRRLQHTFIKVEVSLNEVICEDETLVQDDIAIKIASLNDIISEKLRSILQQIPRRRNRPRDFYDIWHFYTHHRELLDLDRIATYLVRKSAAREVSVNKAAFHRTEILARGQVGFAALKETLDPSTQDQFPAFEEAVAAVHALVADLDIPAQE